MRMNWSNAATDKGHILNILRVLCAMYFLFFLSSPAQKYGRVCSSHDRLKGNRGSARYVAEGQAPSAPDNDKHFEFHVQARRARV